MSTAPKTSRISVIIPTLNEAANLDAALEPLRDNPDLEIIVADGGSSDATASLAAEAGARLVNSGTGRGVQQNCGAAAATGEILLFLHADTRLPEDFAGLIHACLNEKGVAGGAFSLSINTERPPLRLIAALANLRSRLLQLPYGDQALFMTRKNFARIGGFPEIEIMEDFALVGKLRKLGRIRILTARVTTSGRRWQKLGILRTTLINQAIVIGYLLGRSPTSLASWYRISSRSR